MGVKQGQNETGTKGEPKMGGATVGLEEFIGQLIGTQAAIDIIQGITDRLDDLKLEKPLVTDINSINETINKYKVGHVLLCFTYHSHQSPVSSF